MHNHVHTTHIQNVTVGWDCCRSPYRYCGRNHLCTLCLLLSGKETTRCSVCEALFVLSCQEKYFTVISMWVTLSPLREKGTHLGCVCHGNTLSSRYHYHTHLHVLGGTERFDIPKQVGTKCPGLQEGLHWDTGILLTDLISPQGMNDNSG